MKEEQHRIRDCNGVFTIQKKRFIKQFRMFRPSKIVEQWDEVDENGNSLKHNPQQISRMFAQYKTLGQTQTAMQQFIEGVKYHYPSKVVDSMNDINPSGLPKFKNPPPPPPPTFPKDRTTKRN